MKKNDYRSFEHFEGVVDEVTCRFYPGITAILGWTIGVKFQPIEVALGNVDSYIFSPS